MSTAPSKTDAHLEYALGMTRFFPPRGAWTLDEYLDLKDGRAGVEFANGDLEFLPMPTVVHQTLPRRVFLIAYAVIESMGAARSTTAGCE